MNSKFGKALTVISLFLVIAVVIFIYTAVAAPPKTAPAAPTSLSASNVSCSCNRLSWTDNSSTEDGFKIERCAGSGCTSFAQIAMVGAGVITYDNSGLSAGTSYSYRVRSYNIVGNSAYSNTASATTGPSPCATPTPSGPSGAQ